MRDLIRTALGNDALLDSEAVHSYAVHGKAPEAVVAPRNAEEAAALLKLAAQEGFSVECSGGGTRLRGGNAPGKVDVVLTSARMNKVFEYEAADLVIGVEAGTRFTALEKTVSPHNQFFALDPAGSEASTIGSAIATGSAGPLRFAHGTPRDQVLGLEFVSGDGRVLHFGGRVVKNVAGYDVVRLMVGSRGTLGFITRVNVRLKPQPESDQTLAVCAGSFSAVADINDAIVGSGLDPVALEIVSDQLSHSLLASPGWTLLVRLHGNGLAVQDAQQQIRELARSVTVETLNTTVWQTLATLEAGAAVQIRLANLPSLLRDTASAALRLAQAAAITNARLAIHAGDGIVRLLGDDADAAVIATIVAHERAELEHHGGSLIIERTPHGVEIDAFGHPGAARLMQEMKKVFDPAGVLGRGRFVV